MYYYQNHILGYGQATASYLWDCINHRGQVRDTYLKWETALKKALEFIVAAPGLPPDDGEDVKILIVISTGSRMITEPDRQHVKKSVGIVGACCAFIE